MKKYNVISGSNRNAIFDKLMHSFVVMHRFEAFAKINEGIYVHQFDFLKNSHTLLYREIIEAIKCMKNDAFYIVWNFSTKYVDGCLAEPNFSVGFIQKSNLIDMLEAQLIDMVEDALCYCKNPDLFQYQDMFIFDDSYQWALVITHEDCVDGKRLCFSAQSDL